MATVPQASAADVPGAQKEMSDKQRYGRYLVEGVVAAAFAAPVQSGASRKLVASATYAAVAAAMSGAGELVELGEGCTVADEDMHQRVEHLAGGLEVHRELDCRLGHHTHFLGQALAQARA